MTAVETEGRDDGDDVVTSMFISPEFGFGTHVSSALARLYGYIAHGIELPATDIKKWSECGVFDTASRHVRMPGPVDVALSWILLGLMWDGKISLLPGT